ncbi:MAG TPA: endonuclease/exonuclease/phosphatase family protein [Methylomirabilota bacterium]|nr:endonuclease/exonuclease/phosphatase family protein [Methylomirabilota bacterium]
MIRLTLLLLLCATAHAASTLRVMTFKMWHGGDQGGQPLSQSAKVITAANADLIGLQETRGHSKDGGPRPDRARELSTMLQFHYLDQGDNRGILSRFPIITNTPAKYGAKIRLNDGKEVWLFNVHLAHAPYQPYQLLGIPYADGAFLKTADEAIAAARAARGAQIKTVLAEIARVSTNDIPIFLTGDFNEPSHQDWTPRAAGAKLCPLPVDWPATKAVVDAGFTDSYRKMFPNELTHRGLTWTPITAENDPKDRHDRIDMIFYKGGMITVSKTEIVGETPQKADVVVKAYPSDHRAVLSTLRAE